MCFRIMIDLINHDIDNIMHDTSVSDRRGTPSRTTTPGRPRSQRELYHPAVQDLSEQAARNGAQAPPDEGILSVVSSCTPRGARTGDGSYSEKFQTPTPLLSQYCPEEAIRASPTATMCFNSHHTEYLEDLHRQRVLVSAHQRRKLHSRIRRSKSTPAGGGRRFNGSVPDMMSDKFRNSVNSSDDDSDKLEFVITNRPNLDEKNFKERINYRLTNRTKPKTAHAVLMPNGAPLSMVNGYTQTLIQNYPQYTQKYCSWLTSGFKVQSVRSSNRAPTVYSHARPPPPLLQYINRPRTVAGTSRFGPKKARSVSSMGVVGTQKTHTQKLEFPGGQRVIIRTGGFIGTKKYIT
ncbi:uncharacterized protein LOC127877649 isoform X1 [Dreissena polymorpha]|uniref:uncharacterized protein LOC127877649 isoform X1 n=1 Tax=Dreissena polymorpha TaxID=45954 RepID=UPI002263B063|nr:uncharacterized protein LOC127877649 isoform X1 [Dreissena polymorpha]